jgi:hypothetical protein
MIDFEKRRELQRSLDTEANNIEPTDEITRLRRAVKSAYIEGWLDGHNCGVTQEALAYDWDMSAARAAIREGGKDD